MGNLGLVSLLRSGTITRIQGEDKSTINLVLTTHGLANARITCKVHDIVHGSDHVIIKSSFDLLMPKQTHVGRLLFKEAPWPRIQELALSLLKSSPLPDNAQEKCNRLINAVNQAVRSFTPIAKPSPYAKRWWSKELTELKISQARLRNLARRSRHGRIRDTELERAANTATRQYHEAIRY